jgi:glutathione synthase/RimK-type ligase-like ATP-grasp enzyme
LFTYSTATTIADWQQENLSSAPLLCQELFQKKVDLRVTVIHNDIFAVRIEEDGHGIEGDWRVRPREHVRFVPTELTDRCATLCRELAMALGLTFAAIDLLEIEDDRQLVFLEVNPTGEWGWLVRCGLPIDAAIADWLSS